MKSTYLSVSIVIAGFLIAGAIMVLGAKNNSVSSIQEDNVTVVDGIQIITISAKGGYTPRVTNAKANIPTIIKVETQGTFDCSAAVSIPSLGVRKNLPPTGETEFEVPPQKAGTVMRGLCAMGMYNFSINFSD